MVSTGFKAYATYIFIKNLHFSNSTFDVMKLTGIPLEKKLIDSWNNKRRKKDGLKFKAIEDECSNIHVLALLYGSYYVKNPNFYIQDIFEDNFETYKKNLVVLKNIKEVLTNDIKCVIMNCKENQIRPKTLFVSSNNSLPKILKMGYGVNTLIVFDYLFDILKANENLVVNELEKEVLQNVRLNIRWMYPIVRSYIDKYDWKAITKEILEITK